MLYSHPLTSAPHSISAKVDAMSPIDSSQDAREYSDRKLASTANCTPSASADYFARKCAHACRSSYESFVYEHVMMTKPPAHCWNTEYLGDKCVAEFMNSYHRINVFKFKVGAPIKSLLRPDTPVEAADIRGVGPIQIYLSYSANLAASATLDPKWIGRDKEYLEDLTIILIEFAKYNKGARITVHIKDIIIWAFHRQYKSDNPNSKTMVNTSDDDIHKFLFNMSNDIFPMFENLKSAGHRVNIVLHTKWGSTKLPSDLACSAEAWFSKMKAFQQVCVI
jgi:hypothetical protein